ncbi:MAG: DEAD/DEAH box helicase [Thaumarchaeota archaeon]|nr:DEAD/DEAH box helicase [Nitrososphaerota archaeon]
MNTVEEKASQDFDTLQLKPEVLRSLREIGYKTMFPIQAEAIPPLLAGKDVIGQAHTGSGKTAAYALPIIERVDGSKPYVQALVVVPTRELAMQVTEEFNKLSKYLNVRAYSIYGGQAITPQIERLRRKTPQIVVATPGRLIDHLERGTIDLLDVRFVVLDEADRMLDMGFIDDVDYIMKKLPNEGQTSLFSATMPREIVRLADKYMNHPVNVLIDNDELSVDEIDQTYAIVDERSKFQALVEYIRKNKISSGIIFCATKIKTQRMAERLQAQGFKAAPIHGDLSQNRREHAMQNFRSGYIELLVATDVAARGIDVPKVGHIINYDVPQDPLTYFHRIGRTARAGRAGKAISLVSNSEYPDFSRIAGMTQVEIKRVTDVLPAGYRPPPMDTSSQNYSRGGRRYQGDRRRPSFRRDDSDNRDSRPQGARPGGFSFTEKTAAGGFGGSRDRPGFSQDRSRDSRDSGRRPRRPNYRR